MVPPGMEVGDLHNAKEAHLFPGIRKPITNENRRDAPKSKYKKEVRQSRGMLGRAANRTAVTRNDPKGFMLPPL